MDTNSIFDINLLADDDVTDVVFEILDEIYKVFHSFEVLNELQ